MKKFAMILTAIAMVASLFTCFTVSAAEESVWDGTTPAANADYAFSGGSGTESDPYLISSAADLAQLAVNCNEFANTYAGKYLKLTTDIALNTGYENYADWETNPPANTWIVIGKDFDFHDDDAAFKGVFLGDGHVVRGMYSVNDVPTGGWNVRVGLFGKILGEVYDLGMEYCLSYTPNPDGNTDTKLAGILASMIGTEGDAYTPKVCRCYIDKSTVVSPGESGLLCGQAYFSMEISDCWVNGVVKLIGGRGNNGGFIGEQYTAGGNKFVMKNCYSLAEITKAIWNQHQLVGALGCGDEQIDAVTVSNCYFNSEKCSINSIAAGQFADEDGELNPDRVDITDLAGKKATVKSMKLDASVWVDGANGPVLKVFQADAGNTGDNTGDNTGTNPGTADVISVCVLAAAAAAGVCVLASKKRR